jgi:adenosyl cobinamide kinase/adenosyl cobinamide phosphate guanylyltransferase
LPEERDHSSAPQRETSYRQDEWQTASRKKKAKQTLVASQDHSDLFEDLQTIVNSCLNTNNTNGLLQKL